MLFRSTCAAPRESDSRPSAPLPAKRSRQRAPDTWGPSQLNRVSRTRSGVGRISGDGGKRSFLPRQVPPMIRSTRAWLPRCAPARGAPACGNFVSARCGPVPAPLGARRCDLPGGSNEAISSGGREWPLSAVAYRFLLGPRRRYRENTKRGAQKGFS